MYNHTLGGDDISAFQAALQTNPLIAADVFLTGKRLFLLKF